MKPAGSVRVVFDTGIVVSALLFRSGRLAWLRDVWASGNLVTLASRQTLDELVRVLSCPKFDLDSSQIGLLLGQYVPYVRLVQPAPSRRRSLPKCRDPDDQCFLELARAGRTKFLITGDRDLLALAGTVKFAIVTPAEFQTAMNPGSHRTN